MQSLLRVSRRSVVLSAVGTLAALSFTVAGCGGGSNTTTIAGPTRIVTGQSQTVSGATSGTWARLDATNAVIEAGVTVPFSLIQNPPAAEVHRATRHAGHDDSTIEVGTVGPAGSFIVVEFPSIVKQNTYLNHFEMHWNPEGHPPARYAAKHFDLHFYHSSVAEVLTITPPDLVPPAANRIPAGYIYPGAQETVPQMGVHAVDGSEFAPGAPPFLASMILGYFNGNMHFIEPMITQAALLTKQTITLNVPRPAVLGMATRYPTKFTATYSAELDAYQFVFTDFVNVSQ
ncbi:MAG: cytochrome C [Armatimonadota bacterium]